MSIYRSGALRRSNGIVAAIGKQVKNINLKGVNKIQITFDPFAENVKSTREFLFLLSTPKISKTNPKCLVKTDIVCNRQPPEIRFALSDVAQDQTKVKEIRFISDKLNTLELLQLCNKHISALAPPEDTSAKVLTKAEKQKAAVKRPIKKK